MRAQSEDAARRPEEATPSSLGFRMPAEWEPHERCIMGWPTRQRIPVPWSDQHMLALATHTLLAHAIAKFESVLVIAAPGEGAAARSYLGGDVEVVELPIDDYWLRDSGPLFITHPDGRRAVADFKFNSWGGKYEPYDDDAAIGERLAEYLGVQRFAAPMVLEGGAITVDGEGTLITTESNLLNPTRNPELTRDEMTRILEDYLGVRKVIWLPGGRGPEEDPDTDGHVDGVAAFVGPGRVLAHMVAEDHPDHERMLENKRILETTTDALGRPIATIPFEVDAGPLQFNDASFVSPYINFYFANGGAVVPTLGTADDEAVLDKLRDVLPGREVVGVPCPVIYYAGGGIHCATQQMPATPRREQSTA